MAEKETKKAVAKKTPTKEVKAAAPKKAEKATPKKAAATPSKDFAVIATGGKQYVVRNGDIIKIEKLAGDSKRKEGDKIVFNEVLLTDNGKESTIGTPTVKGAKVEAQLMADDRDKKLHVIRFRAKSRHFRKVGHRQPYTLVQITKV
jgi:large subunit ribosomal protein L21